MKTIYLLIATTIFMGYNSASSQQQSSCFSEENFHNPKMVKTAHQLFCELLQLANKQKIRAYSNEVVVFKASINPPGGLGQIGYGYLFLCKVKEVIQGSLLDEGFTIVVLDDDTEIIKLLESENYPIEILIKAIKFKPNEKSEFPAITGFVDKDKTSWKIVSVEKDN